MTPAKASRARDLPNPLLIAITGGAIGVGAVGAAVFGATSADWARPGSPFLQAAAILGALLLLASLSAVFAKRFGAQGKRGFRAHVGLAAAGLALVLWHWSFSLWQFPTLLLILLGALAALGIWSRTAGARAMAETFGTKHGGFAIPNPAAKEQLRTLIAEKRALLASLDPAANEATFSPQPRHWLCRPIQTLAYHRLAEKERALTGATANLSRGQKHWRMAHRLLAWAFVGGIIVHVLVVTLFAGYVAGDGPVYWWHLAAWDF